MKERLINTSAIDVIRHVGQIPNTIRGMEKYASQFHMNEDDVQQHIRGRVCDVGSGYDGLAVSVRMNNVDAAVYSVNPMRENVSYGSDRLAAYMRYAGENTTEFFGLDQVELERVLAQTDMIAACAFAHELPYQDGFFHTVFDNNATMHYSDEQNPTLYVRSLREMTRVLAPGGHLLIGDWHVATPEGYWYRHHVAQMGLVELERSNGGYVLLQKPK
jgi:SAM-dependent methyltransferase